MIAPHQEMNSSDALRTLQHASDYIFTAKIAAGERKRMRRHSELWQAMATLYLCQNQIENEALASQPATNYGHAALTPKLVCALNA